MYCFRVYVILCSPLIFNLSKIVLIFSCSFTSLSRPVGLFSFFVVFAINLIGFSYSLRARVRFRICELVPLCVCFQRFCSLLALFRCLEFEAGNQRRLTELNHKRINFSASVFVLRMPPHVFLI